MHGSLLSFKEIKSLPKNKIFAVRIHINIEFLNNGGED